MNTEHCRVINVVRFLVAAALLAASLAALAPAPVAHAATLTVNSTNDVDDGACDVTHCSLREAIKYASSGDTINFSVSGIIVLAGGHLTIDKNLTITGPGADQLAVDGNNSSRVFHVREMTGVKITVSISGLTVQNGLAPADERGGGIYNQGQSLILSYCTIQNNATRDDATGDAPHGGGVFSYYSTLTIENSTISGNSTGDGGGTSGEGGYGGGVGLYNSTATIRDSTISGNSTGNGGGAGYGGYGGGVFTYRGTLTIEGSTLSDNSTGDSGWANRDGQGGGLYNWSGNLTLTNVTFSGNRAKGDGGGAFLAAGAGETIAIAHATFTGNIADDDNDGSASGGGIRANTGTMTFRNTIVAGNDDKSGTAYDDCDVHAEFTSAGYNLVGSGTGCPSGGAGDQTTSDPKLGPLQDNGGPTEIHALQYDSPAVEQIPTGTNGCGSDYTTDQRGEARPQGSRCDVGAYESPGVVWDGGGSDNNTSTAQNWGGDTVPGATDIPVFNNVSSKNATVDSDFTAAGWGIASTYGGTISQGGSDLTVNGDWTQSGGTFSGGSGALDLGGGFDLSGGSFTAPSGLTIVSGAFNHTGGTFDPNGGRVLLASTADQTLASSFYDLTINDGLLGYWKLDEGSGATAADASGYGHTGALYNSPVWSTSTPTTMRFYDPYSLGFDRTGSTEYVLTGNIPKLDQAQNLTLSALVRLASTPGGSGLTYMRFVTLENEKAVLRYTDDNGTGKLQFYMRIGGSLYSIHLDYPWATDTWYHVAGTYDGSTMRLYLDFAEQGTLAVSGAADSGGWVRLSHSGNTEALDGLLDDVRIYDRALSSTEIYDLAQRKQHPQTSLATTTLGDTLDVNGTLTLNSGTLDVSTNNYAINLAGDLSRNGGVFTARNGTVTFGGAVTQTLDTDISGLDFYDMMVNSGATLLTRRDYSAYTVTNNGTLQLTKKVAGGAGQVGFLSGGGYGGVIIATGGDLGAVTVTIKGNQDCTTVPGETVRRCFDIAPTNTGTAQVLFYFSGSELSGNDCNALNAYHWNGSAWQVLPLDTSWGGDGRACESEPYSVRVYPVSDFSPFVLSDEDPGGSPTAVTLASFTATAVDDGVLLEWETASEIDVLGFHLYRAETPDGPQTRLNADLIPGQVPGSPTGAVYQFRDEVPESGNVEPGASYWYWLEGVDTHGWATRHGPVSAQVTPGDQYRIYLPLVSR